jgi:hypothetical protein
MEHTHSTNGDAFSNEVKVGLHMLGALVLYRVGGEVNGADVVVVDEAGGVEGVVQFLEKLLQPGNFSNTVGDSTVFSLGARLETVCCRLEDQETRLPPRKTV